MLFVARQFEALVVLLSAALSPGRSVVKLFCCQVVLRQDTIYRFLCTIANANACLHLTSARPGRIHFRFM